MNHLEEYIRNNKQLFDEEPEKGHFERLQQKMKQPPRKINMLRWSISIAASVAILLVAGIVWQHAGKQGNAVMVCENSDDMKVCYLDKMNVLAGQIEELTSDFDQWDQQQVMNDVQDIIDATQSDFETEIPKELPDETAKSILTDYYRQNLESLQMIAKTLEKSEK